MSQLIKRQHNPQTEMGIRAEFRRQLINDPKLKDAYYKWVDDYIEIKASYATYQFRGFTRGERGGR